MSTDALREAPTLQERAIKYARDAGYGKDEPNFNRVFYAFCAGFSEGASPTEGAEPDFDVWMQNSYTKVLMESIKNDYTPKHAAQPAPPEGASRLTDERRLKEWLDDYAHVPLTAMEKRVAEEAWRAALAIQGAEPLCMCKDRVLSKCPWGYAPCVAEFDPVRLPSAERCSGPDGEPFNAATLAQIAAVRPDLIESMHGVLNHQTERSRGERCGGPTGNTES